MSKLGLCIVVLFMVVYFVFVTTVVLDTMFFDGPCLSAWDLEGPECYALRQTVG